MPLRRLHALANPAITDRGACACATMSTITTSTTTTTIVVRVPARS
jgi:hypothetical protein